MTLSSPSAHHPGMTTTQKRQPVGTPTGGQFATGSRAETSTTLDAPSGYDVESVITAARGSLADSLGVPATDVTVEFNDSHLCGKEAGAVHVRMHADVPDDPARQQVALGFYREPSGRTTEMACEVSWARTPLPGLDYTRDVTSTAFDYSRTADPETIASTVGYTLRQAEVQRAIDTRVNDPQSSKILNDPSPRRGASWWDILSIRANQTAEGLFLEFEDRTNGERRNRVILAVDDTDKVSRGRLDSDFGWVSLDGENLERVCGELEWNMRWALDTPPESRSTKADLDARLQRILQATR